MHVLLASHRYHPVPGGSERVVQGIAEGLLRRGHRATVLTQSEPGCPATETVNGVEVRRIPVRAFAGLRIPKRYLPTLRAIPADLFHLHGNRIWNADFYFPRARSFTWPQVLTGHGFYQWEMHPRWRDRVYFRYYFPRAARAFDAYTPDTERERDQLVSWGVEPARLTIVPLGIDVEEFDRPPEGTSEFREHVGVHRPLLAVYVGGFFENKRVDRLIEALAPVRDHWSLVAIGRDLPGSRYDREYCVHRAATLGVEFRAPGVLPRSETLQALFAADAILLGSEYEGFGLILLEAMAAGRPFVTFRTGAAAELASTGAGIAVARPDEFTAALHRLMDSEERRSLGERGRQAAKLYTTDRMVERYLQVYQAVLSRRGARVG